MKDKTKIRIYEIIPGLLLWTALIGSIVLSFIKPLWVIYFIIVFDLYWLTKVIYFVFYMIHSVRKYKNDIKINWLEKTKSLKNWQRIHHIVFLPTAGESLDVLRGTLNSLLKSDYPKDKMMVVLAGEGRMKDDFLPKADVIKHEYSDKFYKLLITVHPDGLPDEIKGKGANAHYAGHKAKEMIDELDIPYKDIIVSYFDSDTCVHERYFSCLTYKYLTHPNPLKTSYQPVALYNNNIWESTPIMRVAAFGTTFWLLTELARPERLFTFSSHSMSWQALVDVGFWQKDIVTDDSRIFLQCFIHYNGDYTVTPMYVPVSMDTVMAKGFWRSLKNLYKQQRRWAWGVEHFPHMVFHFSKNKLIPFKKKIKYLWNLTEGMFSWATAPLFILILGRLPLWVVKGQESTSVVIQNTPFVLEWLMALAMAGIFMSAVFNYLLLSSRPKNVGSYHSLVMFAQWILLPVTLIIFGSIPAVEAQTRLMIGKHLGFWVTEKARK